MCDAPEPEFDLLDFLPYLLNQAADVLSLDFQKHYKTQYGMLRTEWRVLFHIGRYGSLTATEICDRARLHKTKVSRAVKALEDKRFLARNTVEADRRHERLNLTVTGLRVFETLQKDARIFDAAIRAKMTPEEAQILHRCLVRIADLPDRN
ncbi:MAG: MarR family winged helix-turn-helix transcriptional regulator [Aliishimia sp.]